MELYPFFLAPHEQCTSIYRCALFIRAKKKTLFYSSFLLKKCLSLSFTLTVPLSLSLSSHLSQSQLSQLRYLSQPHSLNVVLRLLGRGCAPASWIEVAFRGSWLCSGLVDRSGFPHLHSAAGSWLCSSMRWYRG